MLPVCASGRPTSGLSSSRRRNDQRPSKPPPQPQPPPLPRRIPSRSTITHTLHTSTVTRATSARPAQRLPLPNIGYGNLAVDHFLHNRGLSNEPATHQQEKVPTARRPYVLHRCTLRWGRRLEHYAAPIVCLVFPYIYVCFQRHAHSIFM